MNSIENRQNNYDMFLNELFTQETLVQHNPFEILIGLTNVCNLNCAFCPYCGFCSKAIEKAEMLDLNYLKELSKFFGTAKFLNPSLRGEPFLYKNIEEFIELCNEQGLLDVMQLTNNGTLLHKFDLKKLKGLGVLAISFDSDDKDTFELLRYKSDFEQILRNVELARKELPDTHIKFCSCINRYNIDDMVGIYEIARNIGINSITFNSIFGGEDDKVIQLLRLRNSDKARINQQFNQIDQLNCDDKIEIANVITWYDFEDNIPLDKEKIRLELISLRDSVPYICYDDHLKKNAMDDLSETNESEKNRYPYKLPYCTSPFIMFGQFSDGSVSPCSADFGRIDSVNDKTAFDIWNGKGFTLLREAMFQYDLLPDACKKCESFMRYTHIDQYLEFVESKGIAISDIQIPPNYHPPLSIVSNINLQKILFDMQAGGGINMRHNGELQKGKDTNSKQYWEEYFSSGHWDLCQGEDQTLFFTSIFLDNLPNYILSEMVGKTICDVGCAEGATVHAFAHIFPECSVLGIDWSESAIEKAKHKYPDNDFYVKNFEIEDFTYDILFLSNVLEHLNNPLEKLKRLCRFAHEYVWLIIPYEDNVVEPSHINRFDQEIFDYKIENFEMIFNQIIDTASMQPSYWPGKQAIIIYKRILKEKKKEYMQKNEVPTKETWDQVASSYLLQLDDSDYRLADDIAAILSKANINAGSSLIELGSGSGHLSACLAMKGYQVTLFDFSQVALDKAKETFEYYHLDGEFINGDLMQLEEVQNKYDIAWNSGVMEHFGDSELEIVLCNAKQFAKVGVLFLVPNPESVSYLLMRARLMSEEKWNFGTEYLRNDYENHMRNIGLKEIEKKFIYTPQISNYLINTAENNNLLGNSLSELYKLLMNEKLLPMQEGYLVSFFALLGDEELIPKMMNYKTTLTVLNTKVFDLNAELFGSRTQCQMQKDETRIWKEHCEELSSQYEVEKQKVRGEIAENEFIKKELQNKLVEFHDLQMANENLNGTLLECHTQLNQYKNDAEQMQKENQSSIAALSTLNEKLEQEILNHTKLEQELHIKEDCILQARNQCLGMTNSKLFKLVHLLYRFKYEGLKGNRTERKNFRQWIFSKTKGSGGDSERRYNPLYAVIEKLDGKNKNLLTVSSRIDGRIECDPNSTNLLSSYLLKEEKRFEKCLKKALTSEARKIDEIIRSRIYTNIIIYPHVVHWEPLQTPQQLLKKFAQSGWLCFFCEHPNLPDLFREEENNLFIVHEADLLQVLVKEKMKTHILFTWIGSLSFTNRIENKVLWYHLLDKIDLFPYYDGCYLELHNQVVTSSNLVSYVADPLLECIGNREDAIYLPNAVNPDDFLNIHENHIPEDLESILEKKHKIVGYYGYLAEWMDYDLVLNLARQRPDYEFVLIGKEITEAVSKIKNVSNIHLLGFKKYTELADYAKYFDIAFIPFVITPQMKCVSPIKFYEYCALGLPIITSKMPEVEKYCCNFVACASGQDEFLFFIDHFLSETIVEDARINAPHIAAQNTWLSRIKTIENEFDKELFSLLQQTYDHYDVLIFAVIDFDFRYQRPQQFAARFAENGHRVFYINANHHRENSIEKKADNLYVINLKNDKYSAIHLTDWSENKIVLEKYLDDLLHQYGIRDAVTIVDYPNWISIATYLREKYGFKIIADYMDDFTGFLNPAEDLVSKNCIELLKTSDVVITSSEFLSEIAQQYNANISIIRNGTEFKHFNNASQQIINNPRKIVGYYGAVAHWFSFDIVCYIAEHLQDCDIVIIGEVTAGQEKLNRHTNIKLLGEIPYQKLPEYLKIFDVCLIPFDTNTDLIKATNPVKFYEYLSAGKKIVATEIPELAPYRDKYVYMSNDKDTFLNYVNLCLNHSDQLENTDVCIQFGKENDWQLRYEAIALHCKKSAPLVSIIVLMYNNLELNQKCIESIVSRTAYPNFEIVIVDNCSTDGTKEYLDILEKHNIPNMKIILNEANLGFAGGNNVGMKAAKGDYILLLNNDTLVTRGWLTSLVKHMVNNPKLGMCGPVTNSIGNEAKIKVAYHNRLEMELFSYQYTAEHMNSACTVPTVLALFCTLIKKDIIEHCGYLDERYNVGMFEDDDYAEAVKKVGYKLEIAEDSFIHHYEGASFKKLEDTQFKEIYEKNKSLFEEKWNKKWKMHEKRKGITWDTNSDACADSCKN